MSTNDGHTNDANVELTIGSRKSETIHLSGTTDTFFVQIASPTLALGHSQRTISWDVRFLGLAKLVSTWSKDPSTQCGAVIVRPDKTIASVGFNGFPKGCSDSDELYADRNLKYQRVVHAEVNACLHTRESLEGYTIYTYPACWGPSCANCSAVIIQSGIKRVVHYRDTSEFMDRWKDSCEIGLEMYREAGIEVVSYPEKL